MHRAISAAVLAAASLTARTDAATIDAAIIKVVPGQSIQAAIDGAADGDAIVVAAGVYDEDLDFLGKAISVTGAGPSSVLHGTGTGPVVTFASGETTASVLDSFLITGGNAAEGGGIYIDGGSPTIVRNVIADNRAADRGSAVFLAASQAELYNNLIVFNGTSGGDPHSVEIMGDADPVIVNNTIAKGDSNGLIVRPGAAPLIMNNIIANNGAKIDRERRGRGICDFSGGTAAIHYNLFHRNRVAALLTNGTDYRRMRGAQRDIAPPRLLGNLDGPPRFQRKPASSATEAVVPDDFELRATGSSRARDAGNADPAFNDLDGTRNDLGFRGGPFAPAW